jgi:hypothetical protein
MASIDERKIDRRQAARVVMGKELAARHRVMRYDPLDAEPAKMRSNFVWIAPVSRAAHRTERTILENGKRRIDERETAATVVPEPQSEADNAESKSRTDDQCVPRAQRANETVVHEPETEVQAGRILMVTQGLRVFENIAQDGRVETKPRVAEYNVSIRECIFHL